MNYRLFFLCLALSLPSAVRASVDAAPVTFADGLYERFLHERCLSCHQFNSKRSNGRSYTSHRSRYLCENCHRPQLTGLPGGGWMAPTARLDYTGLDAKETCELIKRNAGAGDLRTRLQEHMLHDVRIRWALDSGMTPAGRAAPVPGGYAEWTQLVHAWLDGGMRCE